MDSNIFTIIMFHIEKFCVSLKHIGGSWINQTGDITKKKQNKTQANSQRHDPYRGRGLTSPEIFGLNKAKW